MYGSGGYVFFWFCENTSDVLFSDLSGNFSLSFNQALYQLS